MRDIRAWDDIAKRMLYGKVEQFDDMLGYRFDQHFETETPIYMWSTGLKDRNGKDIYEGDILERQSLYSGEMLRYKVEWDTENARYMSVAINGTLRELVSSSIERECTVCGNIYEHPNLLGGRT